MRSRNTSGSYNFQKASIYSVAISSIGRVGTKFIRVLWLMSCFPVNRSRPSFSKRVHRAVLGKACNIPNRAVGMAASSTKLIMRSAAPFFSPSKPMINPAIGRNPALIIFSTVSVNELRVFWNFLVNCKLSSSGVSIPKKTASK